MVVVKLEREDEEEGSPHVIAPFFPQVRDLSVLMVATIIPGFSPCNLGHHGWSLCDHIKISLLSHIKECMVATSLRRGWGMLNYVCTCNIPTDHDYDIFLLNVSKIDAET